ncbi:MAG: winged helix DNA-binding domain-containing protein [Myxococcota bacterium]|nr:winged helix DNA-binding domain-containing protein [Myxococcota bacterium]
MALDIARARLATQRLVAPYFATPVDVVRGLVAVQAQDYAAGLWAIGQRTADATRADVERALADREIVRTWPMRGTLHVVARDDVRWLTAFLAARVLKRAAGRHRQLGLDAKTFAKARTLFEKHLAGGNSLTRPEMYAILARAKIAPGDQRGTHILTTLAMERLLCFGAHRGKQATYTLLDEWIPSSRTVDGDEALAELARRYFLGHGPATVDDFAWWTGLNLTESRRAVEMVRADLESHGEYWSGPLQTARAGSAQLLSAWDEFTVGYRDRSAMVAAKHVTKTLNGLAWCVAVDGRIVGMWRRARGRVSVEPFARLDARQAKAIERARARYDVFTC